MTIDFEPTLLSPLSGSCNGPCHMPAPPRAVKKTSKRVNQLLLDNLELLSAPLGRPSLELPSLGGHSSLTFELEPQVSRPEDSNAFQSALRRMRERPAPRLIIANPKSRRAAPTLPSRAQAPEAAAAPTPLTDIKEHEMDRTPIREPPQRSKSGLARCA